MLFYDDGAGDYCANCKSADFVVDYHLGECCCAVCGCVADRLTVSSASFKQIFDLNGTRIDQAPLVEHVPTGAFTQTAAEGKAIELARHHASAPYKRITYVGERLSQWQQQEPAIPQADWKLIEEQYIVMTGAPWVNTVSRWPPEKWNPANPLWAKDRVFTKEDCRLLLWEVDNALLSGEKRYFVKKYLEKYLTIRAVLCGKQSSGLQASADLGYAVREIFAKLQHPFDLLVRNGERSRYSFLNYNFVFRRIFDLLGASQFGADFPPLKSKKKRDDICRLWLKLIKHLRWPYLNSDGELFGSEYETDIRTISTEPVQRKRPGKRARTDTSGNDCGLGGKHDERADQPVDNEPYEQELLNVLRAHCGTGSLFADWADDGDRGGVRQCGLQFLDFDFHAGSGGFSSEPTAQKRQDAH